MEQRQENEYVLHRVLTDKQKADAYDLWQRCFGDSKEYMDCYFAWRLKENQVLSLYDHEIMTSMVHLNPYSLKVVSKEVGANYIVGVATREEYRKKGLMRRLLIKALREMYQEGQEFTYLMPASEAIYLPFDFRYIYQQQRIKMRWKMDKSLLNEKEDVNQDDQLKAADIGEHLPDNKHAVAKSINEVTLYPIEDREKGQELTTYKIYDGIDKIKVGKLLNYVDKILSESQEIYAIRDAHYYERLQAEMRSAGGEVLILYNKDTIIGCLSYMLEGNQAEITETICDSSYTLDIVNCVKKAILDQWKMKQTDIVKEIARKDSKRNSDKDILEITFLESEYLQKDLLKKSGDEEVTKPIIMARIVNLINFMSHITAKRSFSILIKVKDPIIPENDKTWKLSFTQKEQEYPCQIMISTEEPELNIDIATFTSLFFGYIAPEDLEQSLTKEVYDKLNDINFFHKIYLNEIV